MLASSDTNFRLVRYQRTFRIERAETEVRRLAVIRRVV